MLRPIFTRSTWLPELDNRGVAYLLFVLGVIGVITELTSTMAVGRLVLFAIAFVAGGLGLVRRRRRFAVASSGERGRTA